MPQLITLLAIHDAPTSSLNLDTCNLVYYFMFIHGLKWTHGEIHKKAFPENEKVILLLYMRLNNKITVNIYDFLYLACA